MHGICVPRLFPLAIDQATWLALGHPFLAHQGTHAAFLEEAAVVAQLGFGKAHRLAIRGAHIGFFRQAAQHFAAPGRTGAEAQGRGDDVRLPLRFTVLPGEQFRAVAHTLRLQRFCSGRNGWCRQGFAVRQPELVVQLAGQAAGEDLIGAALLADGEHGAVPGVALGGAEKGFPGRPC